MQVDNFDRAVEMVGWYSKRWGIEVFHKVLKSGMKVENCRLNSAEKLFRYLSVTSIVAWRIHWLTFFARENPNKSVENFIPTSDWKILFKKVFPRKSRRKPPTFKELTEWIARLGGFLARKWDGFPGNTYMWRGLNRFSDLIEGARLATL